MYQFGEISDLARSVGFLVGRGLEENKGEYAAVVDLRYKVIAVDCHVYPPVKGGGVFTEATTDKLFGCGPVSAAIWREALRKHPGEEFGVLVPEIRFYEAISPRVPTLKSVGEAVSGRNDEWKWILSYSPSLSDIRPSTIARDLMRDVTRSLRPYDLGEFSCRVYLGREKSGVVNRAFL